MWKKTLVYTELIEEDYRGGSLVSTLHSTLLDGWVLDSYHLTPMTGRRSKSKDLRKSNDDDHWVTYIIWSTLLPFLSSRTEMLNNVFRRFQNRYTTWLGICKGGNGTISLSEVSTHLSEKVY